MVRVASKNIKKTMSTVTNMFASDCDVQQLSEKIFLQLGTTECGHITYRHSPPEPKEKSGAHTPPCSLKEANTASMTMYALSSFSACQGGISVYAP